MQEEGRLSSILSWAPPPHPILCLHHEHLSVCQWWLYATRVCWRAAEGVWACFLPVLIPPPEVASECTPGTATHCHCLLLSLSLAVSYCLSLSQSLAVTVSCCYCLLLTVSCSLSLTVTVSCCYCHCFSLSLSVCVSHCQSVTNTMCRCRSLPLSVICGLRELQSYHLWAESVPHLLLSKSPARVVRAGRIVHRCAISCKTAQRK